MTDYQDIEYEVADGRAHITMMRPESHNAISQTLLEELEDALWRADDNTAVHCVILRGAGRSFCAGYDLKRGQLITACFSLFLLGRRPTRMALPI